MKEIRTEEITSDTINKFVNCITNMKPDTTEGKDPPEGNTNCTPETCFLKTDTCKKETNDKKRRRKESLFGKCPVFTTTPTCTPVTTRPTPTLNTVLAKGLERCLTLGGDILEETKKDLQYRLNRTRENDKAEKVRENENFFSAVVVKDPVFPYHPSEVVRTFMETSTNPRWFNRGPVTVLNPDTFNTLTEHLLNNATFRLGELHVDPYTRMAGQFHIQTVRTLRDNLSTRMNPAHPAPLDAAAGEVANYLDRDTLINYAAEMNFINKACDDLETFVNNLA